MTDKYRCGRKWSIGYKVTVWNLLKKTINKKCEMTHER